MTRDLDGQIRIAEKLHSRAANLIIIQTKYKEFNSRTLRMIVAIWNVSILFTHQWVQIQFNSMEFLN